MCIVVDPPSFIPIFRSGDPNHSEFKSVLDWVTEGPAKFVLGGSQYQSELRAIRSVLPILLELEKKGKVVRIGTAEVDAEVTLVRALETSTDFDDPHLVAIVRLTGCKLVCLRDPRAHRYLRSSRFYARASARPKLYTRSRNGRLLCSENLAPCCR